MKKYLFVATLLCATFVYGQQQPVDPQYQDAITVLDAWIDAQLAYRKIPGITIGIVKNQELIWSKGYGVADVKKNVPATPSTIFSICSISKLFTSVAIMQLYDAGKLRLDDDVSKLLPGYNLEQQFPDSGPVTVRGLLTHSSGLPRESDYPYWSNPDFAFPEQRQVYAKLGNQQTLYPASKYFQYSNLGMTLLGEIVEKVSGKPYDVYVEENILKPLRLTSTHPSLPASDWGGKMATGYSAVRRDGSREPVPLFDAKGIRAAAGYASNVEDLARFATWNFRLLNATNTEILRPSTLREMQRIHWTDPDGKITWGLGYSVRMIDGKPIVSHGGSCPGYRTSLILDVKDKLGYVAMINAGAESPEAIIGQARALLAKAAKEKAPKSDSLNLKQYHGTYDVQPWGSEAQVFSWYGKLAIVGFPSDTPADNITLLRHVKGDTFRRIRNDDTLGEEVVFEKDASGKVIRYRTHSNVYQRLK